MPNGAAGLSGNIDLAFALSSDGSIPGRADLDQPTVEGILKQKVKESDGWSGAHSAAFDGLLGGPIALVQNIIVTVFHAFTGMITTGWNNLVEILEHVGDGITTFITTLIPGLDASNIISGQFAMNMIEGLVEFLESVPILGDLVEAIVGIPGTIADIAEWALDVLNNRSPLPAGNLFGQIGAGLIGLIPGSHVADTSPNLLLDGDFPDATSMAGEEVWTWDGAAGHTQVGCASVLCNGSVRDLYSDIIPVAEGNVLAGSGWTTWSGLVGAGSNPIKLRLICYNNTGTSNRPVWAQTDTITLATDTSGLAGSGWRELTGNYTVPINVDGVRLNVHIDATATAGTVKWDDLSLTKTQKMPLSLMDGLTDIIGNIWQTFQDIIDAIVAAIRRVPFVGGVMADVIEALEDFVGFSHDTNGIATGAQSGLDDLLWKLLNVPNTILGFIGDEIVPGIAHILENIWNGLTGHSDTDGVVGHAEAQAVLESSAASLTAAQAEIALLKQSLTSGVSANDTFNRAAADYGTTLWSPVTIGGTVSYPTGGSGHLETDGNNLFWDHSGNTPNTKLLRWIGTGPTSNTKYQAVSIVLASRGEDPLFGKTSSNHILARVSSDGLNYLRLQANAYVGNTSDPALQLFYCVGGVETRLWWADVGPVPGAGANITLLAGLKGSNDRTHTIIVNNNIIDQVTESSPVSWLSTTPNTMGWGCGMSAGNNIGIWPIQRQAKPAKINTWTAQDQ